MRIPIGLELRAFDSTDAERVRHWRNDHKVWRWCRQQDLISDVAQRDWFERQYRDPTIKMFGVWLKVGAGADLVGVAGLTSIDYVNRRAEFSLYISPEKHRQGLGGSSLRLLLDHAFLNLGLEQVWGECLEGNPAVKLFEALGFKRDGVRRAFYFKDGRYWDAHLVSITRSEWYELTGRSQRGVVAGDPLPSRPEVAGSSDGPKPAARPWGRKQRAGGAVKAPAESLGDRRPEGLDQRAEGSGSAPQ